MSSSNGDPVKEEVQRKGLSFIQFLILSSVASGSPYGFEYAVMAVGVGWTLLGLVLLALLLSLPSALISTELISLMPTNHGQLAWVYRSMSNFKGTIFGSPIGDFLGFINGANILQYYLFMAPFMPIIFCSYLETLIGDLSTGYAYLVKLGMSLYIWDHPPICCVSTFAECCLAVIVVAFVINALNINIVGNTINTMMYVRCFLFHYIPHRMFF